MSEKISALMDCEVAPQDVVAVVDALLASAEQQAQWHRWHLARDAIGQPHLAVSPDFMQKFSAKLAQEPVVIAPRRLRVPQSRWLPLAAVASVVFVGLVAWQYALPTVLPADLLAQQKTIELKSAEISPYLAAHRDGFSNPLASEQFAQAHFEVGEQH
ncbi:sigma-E factor negative regulatory protein [Deefgea salmonis]|uniref:Sigma-E factor negative regulatory protein n=1 Tax=Deefgea salmonis TaxID=2875502 RepID=A0ABS8BGP3_9NEIS|nr:sigma-E factor negative regulatory protein [Deefgea salmonis]MCB5194877.1 sigma-E factor negative regulatory protein [Deefgea salmonis]